MIRWTVDVPPDSNEAKPTSRQCSIRGQFGQLIVVLIYVIVSILVSSQSSASDGTYRSAYTTSAVLKSSAMFLRKVGAVFFVVTSSL